MISDLTAGLILLAVYVRCAPIVIRRRPATPVVGRITFEGGGEGSLSPTGIRISAQGWRSGTEATLGAPDPGYSNPNGVASVPESIPDVFLIPALAMKHEISGGFSGSDTTPLGLGNFWCRCPGVGFTALRHLSSRSLGEGGTPGLNPYPLWRCRRHRSRPHKTPKPLSFNRSVTEH